MKEWVSPGPTNGELWASRGWPAPVGAGGLGGPGAVPCYFMPPYFTPYRASTPATTIHRPSSKRSS